ncbi:MAG TPA: elongation factor G, partial [Planctomycetota bacterium]|nr:elongation factor G [Planctomycetota bacterium]
AHHAVKEALEKAGYLLLEPIMKFQVQTPNTYMGDVISHIGSRRGEIQNVETHNDIQIISGKVPIAEMFGYADKLRSLTQGRGTYTMEPLEYAPVPEDIQKKVTQFY